MARLVQQVLADRQVQMGSQDRVVSQDQRDPTGDLDRRAIAENQGEQELPEHLDSRDFPGNAGPQVVLVL